MSDNHYSHSSRANSSLFLITCLYRAITAISFANSEFIAPEKWYYNILYIYVSQSNMYGRLRITEDIEFLQNQVRTAQFLMQGNEI